MAGDNCMEHGEQLARHEERINALHGRFDDLTMSVTGLTVQVHTLTATLDKYKTYIGVLIFLMALDNSGIQLAIKTILKTFIGG